MSVVKEIVIPIFVVGVMVAALGYTMDYNRHYQNDNACSEYATTFNIETRFVWKGGCFKYNERYSKWERIHLW